MTWWHYLLLANVYLTLFFVFYTLFLRKETFFNLNRVYLVSAALLSFFIPVIQADWIKNLFITQKVKETIYHVGPAVYQFTVTSTTATPQYHLTLGQILGGIYVIGILVLTFRFIYQLAVLNWVINQPKSDTTYSFFNQIKVEDRDVDNDAINAHEQAHARQWHSADILLLEAIMIINWFNPVVYLYRNAVKHIHEFIADRDALKAGTDKAEYAMLLLSQTFTTPPYHLISPFFNHSLLKQRILMLHKNKSQRIMLAKYGLSAPLFALMLVLSSATVNKSKTINAINNTASVVFTTPASFDGIISGNQGRISQQDLSEADKADLYKVIKQHEQAAAEMQNQTPAVPDNKPANTNEDDKGDVFTSVENSANFPGGLESFYSFLSHAIRYPAQAREDKIQGKVFITFIVEKDGSLTDMKVLRDAGGGLGDEALRVMKQSPRWIPGIQNGRVVRQQFTVPIAFTLVDEKATDARRSIAHVNNNNPTNTVAFSYSPVPALTIEKATPDTLTASDFRVAMTNKVASVQFVADARPIDAPKIKLNVQAPPATNTLKEKVVTGFFGQKAANSVVQIITKHKPFYHQDDLTN